MRVRSQSPDSKPAACQFVCRTTSPRVLETAFKPKALNAEPSSERALLEGAQPLAPWKLPAPDTVQEQRKMLRALREWDWRPWEEAKHLHGDRAFVLRAVAVNGWALEYASQELKADKEIVLQAVAANAGALQYATQELKADKEIVLQAVAANAEALQYATQELKADKEIVLQAVAADGGALEYAAQELKADKEVVAAAVRGEPEVLEEAAEALRSSRDFVKRLVRETKAWWLVEWATEELRQDAALRKECQDLCGTGVVFSYYQSATAFMAMRRRFKASGASVPGGEAYEPVMEQLRDANHGSAPAAKRLPWPSLLSWVLRKLEASKFQGNAGQVIFFSRRRPL